MPKRSFDPEKVVFLGPDSHGVHIEDDALIILGSQYPKRFDEETPLSLQQKYDMNHAGILNEIAATFYSSPTLLAPSEIREIAAASPDMMQRFQRAATRVLAQHGYFPPMAEMTSRQAMTEQRAEYVVAPETDPVAHEYQPDYLRVA